MVIPYWNDLYSGWGWFLWVGILFLLLSSFGNLGYTYRAHRKISEGYSKKTALEILNERYALGEIKHEDYLRMKSHVLTDAKEPTKMGASEQSA